MIADIILKIAEEEGKSEYGKKYMPRPSMAGPERCIRQMVYWGLGFPAKSLPGRAVMIFSDSSFHEDLTADWIRKTSFQLHSEQMHLNIPVLGLGLKKRKCNADKCEEIVPADHISGHIDGILTDILKNDIHWEHKAINHFTFEKLWLGEYPLDNLTQSSFYTGALQKINPDLARSLLLIKNKNTAQYMEFLTEYDERKDTLMVIEKMRSTGERTKCDFEIKNIVGDAKNKFNLVHDYIKRKTLPKRQYDIDHWRCEYCQFGQCWEGYEKEFKELKTDEMLPNEVADLVRYKRETSAHRLEMEKEEKDFQTKIMKVMDDAGVRMGKAGEYVCEIKLTERKNLDKSLIPDNILKAATKKSHGKRLYIRKI